MKLIIVLYLGTLAICQGYTTPAHYTYSTEDDDLDIENIVGNIAILEEFYECFMDKGHCDPFGKVVKTRLHEIFAEACARCSTVQKHNLRRFLEELKKKFPKEYRQFKKKYDPYGEYFKNLVRAIAYA